METIKTRFNKMPKEGLFLGYIKQRIKKNKNFLCAITGPTGSGKTYSSLKIAEVLDEDFNKDRIVFTPKEFINLLNNGNLKSGSVIVFDEAGVSLNNRAWQSIANNLIQYVLQTFRHKNYIVLFTAPDFSFIDKSSRKLFHSYMETKGINFTKKKCQLKPFMLQINQRSGDVYFKYLTTILPVIGETKIQSLSVGLPSKDLIKEYEIKKADFTRSLNEDIERKLQEKEDKESKDNELPELTERQEEIKTLFDEVNKPQDVADLLNMSLKGVYTHIKAIKKKGYSISTNNKKIVENLEN